MCLSPLLTDEGVPYSDRAAACGRDMSHEGRVFSSRIAFQGGGAAAALCARDGFFTSALTFSAGAAVNGVSHLSRVVPARFRPLRCLL